MIEQQSSTRECLSHSHITVSIFMKKNSAEPQQATTYAYSKFSSEVNKALENFITHGKAEGNTVEVLLNGAAGSAVRQHVSREVRAADGIFFSSTAIAEHVAACIAHKLEAGSTVADPACGAGDLLLACARKFKPVTTVAKRLATWEKRVIGIDIHASFVEAAQARLALLAVSQNGGKIIKSLPTTTFPNISQGDYFVNAKRIGEADCVVMNPPFVTVKAPPECGWGSGNVQLAGLFLSKAVESAKIGQEIVAVLPDVLRSGSRYSRWRQQISAASTIKKIHVYGRFDETTDVDVFILHLTKTKQSTPDLEVWKVENTLPDNSVLLKESFKVSVGAYVPFRAQESDPAVAYLNVADARPDQEVSANAKCHFNGTLHQTPFVVIRRTSNPSDMRRVIPTLVTEPSHVAVENHLIVIRPIDGSLQSCRNLMAHLGRQYVDAWMNQAIRCRHLTTAIVKNLPLIGWK